MDTANRIVLTQKDSRMKIKVIDNEVIHFHSDSGELLLSEDLREVIRPELLEELEAEE